jgi:alpha-methylacyl-CoA racemase
MLDGVKILDLSRLLPGPACTWYLGSMGAQVDRIESLTGGDLSRQLPPYVDGVGAIYASVSGGKRSVGMNLRHERAAELLQRLAGAYDVLVEGFRPGVLEAIGLAPETLAGDGGIVVARISGFGQDGPWSSRPGHDINYLGLAGAMSAMGHGDQGPVTPPFQLADMGGAAITAMGIAAALFQRERTGKGAVLDSSLTEAALSFMAPHITAWSVEGRDAYPGREPLSGGLAVYGSYRCRDGKWLALGALEPKFQAGLAALAGGLERPQLEVFFRQKDRDDWSTELEGLCGSPELTASEVVSHPQHLARNVLVEQGGATMVRPPFSTRESVGAVPKLGEHTDQVLAEAGFSGDEIVAYRTLGVIN